MKVLFIDPVSPKGHIGFNSIHINALIETFGEVDVVFKTGYKKQSKELKGNLIYEYPIINLPNNGMFNRYVVWCNFRNIQKNVDFSKYNAIVIAYYDEIALNFNLIRNKLYLINHNNVAGALNNKVKWFFFKRLSRKHTMIVLDPLSKERLEQKGIPEVIYINHGLKNPFTLDKHWSVKRLGIKKDFKRIIFSPSDGSSDKCFLSELIRNHSFIRLLEESKTILICKNLNLDDFQILSNNIINVTTRLSEDNYANLFLKSDLILVSYPSSFQYRTSGVLMEALANNKDILISAIPAFKIYDEIIGERDFYSSGYDFITKLKLKLSKSITSIKRDITKISKPDYSFMK